MRPRLILGLRVFVGATLILGGIALLAGARVLQDLPGAWDLAAVAGAWSAALAALLFAPRRRDLPWQVSAAVVLVSMLLAILWAHFDPSGHLVLSGLAPGVALLAGVGILLARSWAWPVAFASVVGFGPLVLAIAPLPQAVVGAGMALFLGDTVALLALHESFFTRTAGGA